MTYADRGADHRTARDIRPVSLQAPTRFDRAGDVQPTGDADSLFSALVGDDVADRIARHPTAVPG